MNKIQVYFMPGMAASPTIFERIQLPESQFDCHYLEWILPEKGEILTHYAARMAQQVRHQNAILIGVSFGGVLVQEMRPFVHPKKIIIISSIKSASELSRKMKLARTTKAYKLIPTQLFENVELLAKFAFGNYVKQRIKLYEKYLSVRNKDYLDWAIEQIINWQRQETDPTVIHIHGDADEVFPIQYIKNPIILKGGTHIMILNKYKWLNENLPKIITEE